MTYLVCCDHEKITVEADDAMGARHRLPCKKCNHFVLKEGEWEMKDIRVYQTNEHIHAKRLPNLITKNATHQNLDWVDLLNMNHGRLA